MAGMFDCQDDTLVMFHCRRCGWTVCCDSDDGWLVDAARGRVLEHVQGHGVLSESEGIPVEHSAAMVTDWSDEPVMEGIERLLREAREGESHPLD